VQHHRLVGCVAPVRVFSVGKDAFGLDEDACGVYQVSFGISEVGWFALARFSYGRQANFGFIGDHKLTIRFCYGSSSTSFKVL